MGRTPGQGSTPARPGGDRSQTDPPSGLGGGVGAYASRLVTKTATIGPQKMVFVALFPVNLLLILNSGDQLFTGNTAKEH